MRPSGHRHLRRYLTSHGAVLVWAGFLLGSSPATAQQAGDPDRISREEIEAHPQLQDALEVIQLLRPRFLRPRGRTSINAQRPEPAIYVDDARVFSAEALTTIPASNLEEIRYLSPVEAGTRYGAGPDGAAHGVILLRTRRQVSRPPD